MMYNKGYAALVHARAPLEKASVAAPRILIVDDQRDISRMLRTALETLRQGYVIVDVPSAEEAMLEMRRGQIDLLVTDLRLPGISGLELIRRLRKASSEADMIVISAYADENTRAEIVRLGAAFYAKPLVLEDFLEGVKRALAARVGSSAPEAAPAEPEPEQTGAAVRLARLRRDLGAVAVFLVNLDGAIALRAGDVTALDVEAVLTPVVTALSAAHAVGQALGGPGPHSLHFFDGEQYDLYAAGVGPDYALVMLFEGERGAAQMGPVLRYGRQCADDLLAQLRAQGEAAIAAEPAPEAAPLRRVPATAPLRGKPRTGPLAEPPPPAPLTEAELQALDAAARKVKTQDAASFWEAAAGEGDIGEVRAGTLSFEQAAQLGLINDKK
jgi:DNA-binding response OmpR family regulator